MHEILREVESVIPVAFGATPGSCELTPLSGGLESAVARIRFAERRADGREVSRSAIVKRLEGVHRREAALYKALPADFAPQLLAAVDHGDATYLFVEPVRPVTRWPWRNADDARLVMQQLAALHDCGVRPEDAEDWHYESALAVAAAETVSTVDAAAVDELPLGTMRSVVRRLAAALPAGRLQMMEEFGVSFIHGDAHPGNVILRERMGRRSVIFIDWARSRFGSPLEDVASWLQTLRYWEPIAAQRHDWLFHEYLRARGGRSLDRPLREAYWIACASNVMAGALRFHLLRIGETKGRQRENEIGQARHALRVIRRADAVLR